MYRLLITLGIFDWVDDVIDWFGDAFDSLADAIGNAILDAIKEGIGWVCYYLTCAWCELIKAAYAVFAVFAGISKVQMKDDFTYLTNLFFENEAINGIYWGMVMIGAIMAIVFTIIAVVRKMFDISDKQQQSLGQILGGLLKSLFVMITLTAVMSVTMSFTNILVERVSYVFDQNKSLTEKTEIEFSEDEYAAMARILNTIGNYSLNPSYNQRFNLNSCYNEIRPDLLYLQKKGVFDFVYPTRDENGNLQATWQSELEQLAYAANPEKELDLDLYYVESSSALLNIMNTLRYNGDFRPLESFKREYTTADSASLDRVVFLMGTMKAAKNSAYNVDPYITDGLRGAFYSGEKSIYSLSDVKSAFRYQLGGISYIMIWFVGYWVLKNLYRCILNCCTRLVNIVGLYLIAPPLAATMSLDDGRRFKEWTTSMIIQVFGVFGNIIPMRLIILFIPMVLDPDLVLLPSTILNIAAKALLIAGMLEGVSRFSGILTGILANNAGFAAIQASNTNDLADRQFGRHFGKHMPFAEDPDDPLGEKKAAKKEKEKDKREAQKKAMQSGAGSKSALAYAGAAAAATGGAGSIGGNTDTLPGKQGGGDIDNAEVEKAATGIHNGGDGAVDSITGKPILPGGQEDVVGEEKASVPNADSDSVSDPLPQSESGNVKAGVEQGGEQGGKQNESLPSSSANFGKNADGEAYVGVDDEGIPFTESERQAALRSLGTSASGEQYVGRDEFGNKYTEAEHDAYQRMNPGKSMGGSYFGRGSVGVDRSQGGSAGSQPPQKGANAGDGAGVPKKAAPPLPQKSSPVKAGDAPKESPVKAGDGKKEPPLPGNENPNSHS